MSEVNWDMEFGGALLKINDNAPKETLEYLKANGSYFKAYNAWFIEGWEDYEQDPDIESNVTVLGPMHVPSLGGLTHKQKAQIVKEGFMGPKQPDMCPRWLSKNASLPNSDNEVKV